MRRIVVLFLFLIAINSFAQKQGSIDSLYNDFKKIYFASLDKEEHFGAMFYATEWALQPRNPHYRDVWKIYAKQFNTRNEDTLAYRIVDTIVRYFHERDMWNTYGPTKEKYPSLVSTYTAAICPCLTQKLESIKSPDGQYNPEEFNFQKFLSDCRAAMANNTEVTIKINQESQKLLSFDQLPLQKAIFLNLYDNCAEHKKFWLSLFQGEAAQKTGDYLFRLSDTIDDQVISLYQRKKIDSLRVLFPAYADYTQHLARTSSFNPRHHAILFGRNNRDETIRRDTFNYVKNKNIIHQRIIAYSIDGLEIKMLSFEQYPADKIRNRGQLMARLKEEEFLEEPPPPPPPIPRGQ
ncbi:MAG TPA: hypothetical protein VHM26_02150 [Chitinophagaceae bacterium]|jgi:hypothetical protein|nr:hypothetical protein [Chitinophagaceae bacterium]